MGKNKALVKMGPEGKYVVDIEKKIPQEKLKPNTRVALKSDSYLLHEISLMVGIARSAMADGFNRAVLAEQ